MRSFLGRDILSLKDFERMEFFRIFEIAKELEPIARNRKNSDLLQEKTMVTAFYQPSTRTRLAHEAAMHRLGGHVTGFSDAEEEAVGLTAVVPFLLEDCLKERGAIYSKAANWTPMSKWTAN